MIIAGHAGLSVFLAFQWNGLFEAGRADLSALHDAWFWTALVFVPALAARAWAEERRDGAAEALLALPVPAFAMALGKAAAVWCAAALSLATATLPLWLGLARLGPVDAGATLGGCAGALMAAAALSGLGQWMSAIARRPASAFLAGIALCGGLAAMGLPPVLDAARAVAGAEPADALAGLSLLDAWQDVSRGRIGLAGAIWLAVLGLGALTLAALTVEGGRRGPGRGPDLHLLACAALTVLAATGARATLDTAAGDAALDLTEERLFTPSREARAIVAGLESPILVEWFESREAQLSDPELRAHGLRARRLMQALADASNGRVRVVLRRPEPFSADEEAALAAGLQARPSALPGEPPAWLGASAHGRSRALAPAFDPARAAALEADLVGLLAAADAGGRPRAALVTAAPWLAAADSEGRMAPTGAVAQAWAERLDLSIAPEGFTRFPDGTDLVILAHPPELDASQRAALDRHVLAGGKVLAFLDPASLMAGSAGGPPESGGALGPLAAVWGFEVSAAALADRTDALRVESGADGRGAPALDPLLPLAPASRLAPDDTATAGLRRGLLFAAPGRLSALAGGLSARSLVWLGPTAMEVPAGLALSRPDAGDLLGDWRAGGRPAPLALRLTGRARPAFPDSPAARADTDIIVVADADMLAEALWRAPDGSERADNLRFVLQAADLLSGRADLARLAARAPKARPLERVERLRAAAEARFAERRTALEARMRAADAELERLSGEAMSGAPEARERARLVVSGWEREARAARADLRLAQAEARRGPEAVKWQLIGLAGGLAPALVLAGGLALAGRCRRRRRGAEAPV